MYNESQRPKDSGYYIITLIILAFIFVISWQMGGKDFWQEHFDLDKAIEAKRVDFPEIKIIIPSSTQNYEPSEGDTNDKNQ
ncbi:MAG: hypothetical protein ACTSX1_09060 [Candidatus Heimdallarchaeaceae archaeon]